MQWDFKDQLQRDFGKREHGAPETTYYVYDAAGQRVRKVIETQNGTRKEERIYLGGFEIYREYDGNGTTVTLERETLHVMDDKQRIALVETKTHRERQLRSPIPSPLHTLPARQPPRLGQPGAGRGRRADLLRGVSPLRHHGVSSRTQRRGGEPEAVSLHGQGAG